jgi:hypothetical protein
MNVPDIAGQLYEARSRYESKHGPLHPVLRELSPELLLSLVQTSFEDEVALDTQTIEGALGQVDDRVRFILEQVKA